jgi:hypothetical protein
MICYRCNEEIKYDESYGESLLINCHGEHRQQYHLKCPDWERESNLK